MRSAYWLLLLGIGGVSSASLWLRLSEDGPGQLAFRRLCLALPFLALWAWRSGVPLLPRNETQSLQERGLYPRLVGAGLALGAHFYLWNASLRHLPVATSVLLVSLHPFMVCTIEVLRGRIQSRWPAMVGILLTITGSAVLVQAEGGPEPDATLGAALAIGGAAAMTGYLLAGRSLQRRLATPTYVLSVYGIAAIALGMYEWAAGNSPFPTNGREWQLALALALLPTVFAHTPMNAALRRLPATVISTAFLGEAVGASFLVWIFLDETLPASIMWGGPLVVAGIVLTGRFVAAITPTTSTAITSTAITSTAIISTAITPKDEKD